MTYVRSYPFQRDSLLAPPPEFARCRAHDAVPRVLLPSGEQAWLATRYDDVCTVLADPRFSRARLTHADAPRITPVELPSTMATSDPPEHTRLRKPVSRAFTPRRAQNLRARVQQITDELLDSAAEKGPAVDLVEAFTFPMPVAVVCELLGVPYEDRDLLRGWSSCLFSLDDYTSAEILDAYERAAVYFSELIEAKRKHPGEDLLSALANSDDQDTLDGAELVTLAMLVLLVGHSTIMDALSSSVLMLLTEGDQLARLRKEPGLLNSAVEELVRLNPPADNIHMLRVTSEEVELSGVRIPAGEAVIPCVSSANRDSAYFTDPERFDIHRDEAQHVNFGHGPHYCLGAALARVEMQVAIGSLIQRFPQLRLAVDSEDVPWRSALLGIEIRELPVTW